MEACTTVARTVVVDESEAPPMSTSDISVLSIPVEGTKAITRREAEGKWIDIYIVGERRKMEREG